MRRKVTYDPHRDYYVILGVEQQATVGDIRQAYRRCVRECHPDLNPHRAEWATDQIQLVNEAYDVLRDTTLRREYDRLRWPHIPGDPSPFASQTYERRRPPAAEPSPYDPDRPWWEQVVTVPYNRAARRARSQRSEVTPRWLIVSDWLRAHHLSGLNHTWLTLVGLFRSPYASLITVLGGMLAINVTLIIYAMIAPEGREMWENLIPLEQAETSTSEPATALPTPDLIHLLCSYPGAQIHVPVKYDVVGDTFSVFGTVQHPALWNYRIEVSYLGTALAREPFAVEWWTVRAPPPNQTIPEPPVEEDILVDEPVDLTGKPAGYYAIRLVVVLRNGNALTPCDVIVQH